VRDKTEEDLIAVANEWDLAMVQNNADAIGRYMADDWTIVGSDGNMSDKATFLSRADEAHREVMVASALGKETEEHLKAEKQTAARSATRLERMRLTSGRSSGGSSRICPPTLSRTASARARPCATCPEGRRSGRRGAAPTGPGCW
jgi:hypothetical protein